MSCLFSNDPRSFPSLITVSVAYIHSHPFTLANGHGIRMSNHTFSFHTLHFPPKTLIPLNIWWSSFPLSSTCSITEMREWIKGNVTLWSPLTLLPFPSLQHLIVSPFHMNFAKGMGRDLGVYCCSVITTLNAPSFRFFSLSDDFLIRRESARSYVDTCWILLYHRNESVWTRKCCVALYQNMRRKNTQCTRSIIFQ